MHTHTHTHTQSENYINVNYTGSTGNTANKAEPVYSNVPKEVSCTNTIQSLYYTCYSLSPALTAVMWSSRVLRKGGWNQCIVLYFVYVNSQQTHAHRITVLNKVLACSLIPFCVCTFVILEKKNWFKILDESDQSDWLSDLTGGTFEFCEDHVWYAAWGAVCLSWQWRWSPLVWRLCAVVPGGRSLRGRRKRR